MGKQRLKKLTILIFRSFLTLVFIEYETICLVLTSVYKNISPKQNSTLKKKREFTPTSFIINGLCNKHTNTALWLKWSLDYALLQTALKNTIRDKCWHADSRINPCCARNMYLAIGKLVPWQQFRSASPCLRDRVKDPFVRVAVTKCFLHYGSAATHAPKQCVVSRTMGKREKERERGSVCAWNLNHVVHRSAGIQNTPCNDS